MVGVGREFKVKLLFFSIVLTVETNKSGTRLFVRVHEAHVIIPLLIMMMLYF